MKMVHGNAVFIREEAKLARNTHLYTFSMRNFTSFNSVLKKNCKRIGIVEGCAVACLTLQTFYRRGVIFSSYVRYGYGHMIITGCLKYMKILSRGGGLMIG